MNPKWRQGQKVQRWTRKKLLRIRNASVKERRAEEKEQRLADQAIERSGRFADSAFKGVQL